ncbi:MAG TPA: hypothetical protein VLE93_03580 [Candidatus Saccharimonadales bacterium]|nr:hypothetical protein [Candidatus Saccharimonadales bacterium]
MNQLYRQLRHAFHYQLPERRQIIAWLISLAVFIAIIFFGHHSLPGDNGFLAYSFGLYALNSVVFLALFSERPKLKLVMLTSIFLLEIAAIGFFILGVASPR